MSLTATACSVSGTLVQEVVVGGRHHLTTDEPARLGGTGTAPAPHELLPAALAACVSTTLVLYARTRDWSIGDVTVAVDYDHRARPRHFELDIALSGHLSPSQIVRLERVAESCPVRRALEGSAEFTERLTCADTSIADSTRVHPDAVPS